MTKTAEGLACLVCGPRLQDMTAARLRSLLPADVPMRLLVPGAPDCAGVIRLPDRLTGAQAAGHALRLLDDREATLARAKRALIRQRGLTEAQAHRLLQRRAMETGASVLDAARAALRTLAKEEET